MPDFAFVDGESNISIDVCNSQEIDMWKRGAFNWASHIFQDSNSVGLVVGTPVGPSVVREKMSLMFPNIVDGPEIDDKEDSQVTANIFSTFQWYKTQLEECTKACYEDGNCYATWAYMKDFVQKDNIKQYYQELNDAIEVDARYQTWFACHMLNDSYMTKLRDVVAGEKNGDKRTFDTVPMESNAVYNGSPSNRLDWNVLASHYWVKPTPGVFKCDSEKDEEIIHLFATVTIEEF